jgi:hypothetical protein
MKIKDILNIDSINKQTQFYGGNVPFDHCVIDNFFKEDVAYALENEFPDYQDKNLFNYNTGLEVKRTSNNWNIFPKMTYNTLSILNSDIFLNLIQSDILKETWLYIDAGLNGGGWHMHKTNGKLNVHLDYSIHEKLNLQRKLNLIIYLNSNWKASWGGNLGLWKGNQDQPQELTTSIQPKFNRAVIFDTTQNSWHGLPDPIKSPEGEFRKSLAVYYLCTPPGDTDPRKKALYHPTKEQEKDLKILELIKKRSNLNTAADSYSEK